MDNMGIFSKRKGKRPDKEKLDLPKLEKPIHEKKLPANMKVFMKRMNAFIKKFDKNTPKLGNPFVLGEYYRVNTEMSYRGIPIALTIVYTDSQGPQVQFSNTLFKLSEKVELLSLYRELLIRNFKFGFTFGMWSDGSIGIGRYLEVENLDYSKFQRALIEFVDYVGWTVIELAKRFPALTETK